MDTRNKIAIGFLWLVALSLILLLISEGASWALLPVVGYTYAIGMAVILHCLFSMAWGRDYLRIFTRSRRIVLFGFAAFFYLVIPLLWVWMR